MRTQLFQRALVALAGFAALATQASAQFHGAIYTTLGTGTTVNFNIYNAKPDVYLNGGPQNGTANGLPDGTYFYQVTTPSDTLLSTDPADNRRLEVLNGRVHGHIPGVVDPINNPGHPDGATVDYGGGQIAIPVKLIPFGDSPNREYKVWLIKADAATIVGDQATSPILAFNNSDSKTDNFKVQGSTTGTNPQGQLVILKYNDLGTKSVNDGDLPLDGFHFRVKIWDGPDNTGNLIYDQDVVSGQDGPGTINVPAFDSNANGNWYTVDEITVFGWTNSEPGTSHYEGIIPSGQIVGLNFGNWADLNFHIYKYFDANFNNVQDPGEPGLDGIRFNFTYSVNGTPVSTGPYVETAGGGHYDFTYHLLALGDTVTFSTSEILPYLPLPNWFLTENGAVTDLTLSAGGGYTATFGDAYFGGRPCGGLTLGFWSNNNGAKVLAGDSGWADFLNKLGPNYTKVLVDPNGTRHTFGTVNNLSSWLLNGNATNMAYMLSVQLATCELNVRESDLQSVKYKSYSGGCTVSADTVVYVPGAPNGPSVSGGRIRDILSDPTYGPTVLVNGTTTIGNLMSKAIASLAANPVTTASGKTRTYQDALKTLLDLLNNNSASVFTVSTTPPVGPYYNP